MEKRSERVEIPCRIRVVDILSGEEPKDLTRDMEILMETREKWINGIQKAFKEGSELLENIRPWDILLYLDGSITVIEKPIMESVMKDAFAYPVRFQIPSNVLEKFPLDEHPIRSEAFALGCLMYEIHTLSKPYANLEDKLVKQKYMNGEFPTHDDPDLLTRLREYIRANPAAFGFQVAGLVVSALSLLAVPILGLIGFTAIGPAAGTAAAGWQASLGIVQAGSLFAWCQSAAMGGAAAGALAGAGAAGVATAGVATVATNGRSLKDKVIGAASGAFKYATDNFRGTGGKGKDPTEGSKGGSSDTSKDSDDDTKPKL